MKATKTSCALKACVAALLLTYPVVAQPPAGFLAHPEEPWSLKISEKSFDSSTGKLNLHLENTHDYLSVTAFGISTVVSRRDGSGGSQVFSEELLPGEPLSPGETKYLELDFPLAAPGVSESEIEAIKVDLHFEIHSDTTSHGKSDFVAEVFEGRAYRASELEAAVERFERSGTPHKDQDSALRFLSQEAQLGASARIALANPYKQMPPGARERLAESANVASLAKQAIQKNQAGESVDDLLETVRWILHQTLEAYRANARPQDLRKARGEELAND